VNFSVRKISIICNSAKCAALAVSSLDGFLPFDFHSYHGLHPALPLAAGFSGRAKPIIMIIAQLKYMQDNLSFWIMIS